MPTVLFSEFDTITESLFSLSGNFYSLENELRINLKFDPIQHKGIDRTELLKEIWVKFDTQFRNKYNKQLTHYFKIHFIEGEDFTEPVLVPIKNNFTTIYLREFIKFKIYVKLLTVKDVVDKELNYLTPTIPPKTFPNANIQNLRQYSTLSRKSDRSNIKKTIPRNESIRSNFSKSSRNTAKRARTVSEYTEESDEYSSSSEEEETPVVRKIAKSSIPSSFVRNFTRNLPEDIQEVYENLKQVSTHLLSSNPSRDTFDTAITEIKNKMINYPIKTSNSIKFNFEDPMSTINNLKELIENNQTKQDVFNFYKFILLYATKIFQRE